MSWTQGFSIVTYTGSNLQDVDDLDDERSFVGLSNQGATCYMNSLLQTLYMTPEFRQRLYRWHYDPEKHGPEADCIPLQLQLLFAKLQLSNTWYVETTALTKSFGWDLREGFQQHDVQEFCRVLFDAVEQSVANTDQQNFIDDLYEGQLEDYVRCENCNTESKRSDKFLDISLTVRNEFDKVYNDSVTMALENYRKPEFLSGDNKYECSNCTSKQDAAKGLKFKKLPYILVLQLKRFDLDYTTFQRIKLNDRVFFPQILNLNPYLREPSLIRQPSVNIDAAEVGSLSEYSTEVSSVLNTTPDDIDSRELQQLSIKLSDAIYDDEEKTPLKLDYIVRKRVIEKEAVARRAKKIRQIEEYKQEGDEVYELYSILIHSGSALGGHYYAYIKSFETGRWHNFNDSTVREINEKEIQKVYGGENKKSAYSGSYGANAYLLCYRRVTPENCIKVEDSEIPPFVRELLEKDKEREESEAQERADKLAMMQIRVYYESKEKLFSVKREDTLEDLKKQVLEAFGLTSDLQNARLRGYSVYQEVLQDTYDEAKTFGQLGIYNFKSMGLEVKSETEVFLDYDPNSIVLKVYNWDDAITDQPEVSISQKTPEPKRVCISRSCTVRALMTQLESIFDIPVDQQRLLKKGFIGTSNFVETVSSRLNMDQSLSYARVYEGSILYLERLEETRSKSRWQEELEREANRYTIRFNDPEAPPNSFGQIEFNMKVCIDCNETLTKLKKLIAAELNLPETEFLIKRGSKHGFEMKDLTFKLTQCNLMNNSVLFVEKGRPNNPEEYNLVFTLAEIPAAPHWDGMCYHFYELMEIPLDGNLTVAKAKEELCSKINAAFPTLDLKPTLVRLRERNQERLMKALNDSEVLKNYTLYERKNIAVQVLTEPEEEVKPSQLTIIVRKWSPSTWELSQPVELIVDRHSSLDKFGDKVAQAFNMDPEKTSISRISYTWSFVRSELPTEVWYTTHGLGSSLSGNPWYLSIDGAMFVVKDKDEEVREMTAAEKKKYSSFNYSNTSTKTWTYERAREESVKIKVKHPQREETAKKAEEDAETS
jgi:ubiquitin C-terminal hydrolase